VDGVTIFPAALETENDPFWCWGNKYFNTAKQIKSLLKNMFYILKALLLKW
jgi:hypothetical protein